jgi:hypothetical protein
MNLMERVAATQQTIDEFIEQPFQWGKFDCGILAFKHLENCGLKSPLSTLGKYTTERGAKKEIVKLKARNMEDIIDAMGFERIAPQSALPGDIVGYPGGEEGKEWTSLAISIGSGSAIAFANDLCLRGPINLATLAWRVA